LSPDTFRLLADENIHPAVVEFLRSLQANITTVAESGLRGANDQTILHAAFESSQVVLTHDRDFGTLALAAGQPVIGIIYLRPGHILPEFTIGTLEAIFRSSLIPQPPFILVATRRTNTVRIRLRQMDSA
jgi:predicted nuclease of predicted toxin-antitoxin system